MDRLVWGKYIFTVIFCLSLLSLGTSTQATIIHESATLGPTGQTTGLVVDFSQFLGSRFSLTDTIQVDQIGGHIGVGTPSGIFGAIVSLQSSTALPIGTPFDPNEVLASTTFIPPNLSADILVPLSVTLTPGDYAVIFGSAQFGALGAAAMPSNNMDIVGSASYFQWFVPLGSPDPPLWRDNAAINNLRFVVTGSPVPEPSAMLLMGTGLAGLIGWRWKTRTTT